MTTLIKLDVQEIVLLQYRNSEDDFDKDLPMVEKIIQSVKGLPNRTPITEITDYADTTGTYSLEQYPETSKLCNDATSKLAKDLCDTLLNK
jgi:hypothetical protein